MGPGTSIGHFNLIRCNQIWMAENARIKQLTRIDGQFSIRMSRGAFIGTRNAIAGGRPAPGAQVKSRLTLGRMTEITTNAFIDMTESVTLRNGTVIAGRGVQIWTHGFIHREGGGAREMLRGSVLIGRNVYIGSLACINFGVRIADDVSIGSLTPISKSLTAPGLYVAAKIRHLPGTAEERLAKFTPRIGRLGRAYYRQ
jgi:UDP-3-O-[3-hydroxymyristoyl] glucosamine N-acyltransferase